MVTPNASDEQKKEEVTKAPEKTMRKKKVYSRPTVADWLIAQGIRARELQEEEARKNRNLAADEKKPNEEVESEKKEEETKKPRKLTKQEKLCRAAHEIEDLSDLEWETGSENSDQ